MMSSPAAGRTVDMQGRDLNRGDNNRVPSLNALALPGSQDKHENTGALVKSSNEIRKTTPAGDYLIAALADFDPDQFESFAAISDGANKLLMLIYIFDCIDQVLAAVIKAGAAREHEILAEIRDAVCSFICKMEPKKVMDTMLVSRVRILYIRSLLARSPELQSIKVSSVERFLEQAMMAIAEALAVETWRHHVTGGKLREITEEAKAFAIGNKALAALFVHTPAGELQRQIRSWLAENYDFLPVVGADSISGNSTSQLELLSTAIMDGWMAGPGTAQFLSTDALGQLLSEYTKRVYSSQWQHLKEIAGTLATEEAEDAAHVNKLRSALESVDHKRKKEILRQTSTSLLTKSKKKAMLANLDELLERMPSLLDIDHPCAKRKS
ncbi:hypothetical protein ZIOFF_020232 [Zingiber officinale]|uniref:Uncharacterized protein n=1 Tax=Zingiber officinale TaxID=94328 RepID=A0A8J5LL60_ZINOF|nr:hypothetical protein ZIOFF_020232 [Zingiber officinale]